MNRINLVMLLDKLEEFIERAPEIPLTGRVLVDSDELLELTDKIRNAIPQDTEQTDKTPADNGRALSDGQQQAEQMIAQAEEYAFRLVRETEIRKQAEQEAERILQDAKYRAQELEEGARVYAEDTLNKLQTALESTLKIVVNGKEELRPSSTEQPTANGE